MRRSSVTCGRAASTSPAGRATPGDDRPGAVYRVVLPGYFSTMRLPLLHGRDFATADKRQAPDVAVVSDTLVRRNFPDGDALGRRITFDDPTGAAPRG